jgi:predicted anti-sigma-YlaC factor YlaD
LLVLVPLGTACSIRGMAVNSVANAMAASGDNFSSDNDPEFIRSAVPFGLKTMEALLQEKPEHAGLLLALTSGFTQYAYAFIETDALLLEDEDPERARAERARALRMYLRARDYGLRGLELRQPGVTSALMLNPDSAVGGFTREDVPQLYWTGAAWGAAVSIGMRDPALLADYPAVRALFRRAYALDPDWDEGALHEGLIALESVPEPMGGSRARAREHFEHAIRLSGGNKAGPYVSLATGVVVAEQNRREFEELLQAALAVDPDAEPRHRLANLIMQRRARHFLDRADYLFFEEQSEPAGDRLRELPWP